MIDTITFYDSEACHTDIVFDDFKSVTEDSNSPKISPANP